MRKKELAKAERALAKAQAKLAELGAIRAILDSYQRANPKLTVEEVVPLLLRDGRPEDAKRVQDFYAPKATPCSEAPRHKQSADWREMEAEGSGRR